jgi:hypothetical protein
LIQPSARAHAGALTDSCCETPVKESKLTRSQPIEILLPSVKLTTTRGFCLLRFRRLQMVVRIRRMARNGYRLLLQFRHHDLDRLFELWIFALPHLLRFYRAGTHYLGGAISTACASA